MTLEELRKIKSGKYVYYKGACAYLYASVDKRYYLFSNEKGADGSDPYPSVRSSLGFDYSYWLADEYNYDPCCKHLNIMIPKKGRRPI